MFISLPKTAQEALTWDWTRLEPFYRELAERELNASTIDGWLADWSALDKLLSEMNSRLTVAVNADTTDQEAERRYLTFTETTYTNARRARDTLNRKLLASGFQPDGFAVPLRNMRAEVELFREENLPLLVEEKKLGTEYDKLKGAQTVEWEGRELTIDQLHVVYKDTDRAKRERAWRAAVQRQLADREALNGLWGRFLDVRREIARNAGLPDYRAYKWRELLRFDYTPDDCETFHRAIEEVAVPAARRIYETRRKRLGVEALRPWDLDVDRAGRPALHPFETVDELVARTAAIFRCVDAGLGDYFKTMRDERLLDLDNRKGKAPGGYCTRYLAAGRPFIFMNAVGVHDDVQTLLHEGGHAFHVFECAHLNKRQLDIPIEFVEVASMSMELLAAPYLSACAGGFYDDGDAARARREHLEGIVLFWPYMAVVDAFQHWVYTHPDAARHPPDCDAQWAELWARYMPGVDWSGLDDAMMTGWQRKLHIFQAPFYYVEYGLAQLGAVQVWANALQDQAGAVRQYRRALALGGTATLPNLFAAAGARFAFDGGTMAGAVALIERTLVGLEASP